MISVLIWFFSRRSAIMQLLLLLLLTANDLYILHLYSSMVIFLVTKVCISTYNVSEFFFMTAPASSTGLLSSIHRIINDRMEKHGSLFVFISN